MDENLEKLDKMVGEVIDEVTHQMGNDISNADFKAVLNGIKRTIIMQLGKSNSRKWKQWEEEGAYMSIYQQNLDDIWDYAKGEPITTVISNQKTVKPTVTYATSVNRRPTKKLKYKVILTKEVSIFLRQLMNTNSSMEWGVAFTWTRDDDDKSITIDKIYIMPVDVGGGHVDFVNESEFTIFSELSELGKFVTDVDNKTRYAGIMHSHHHMGSWHSSTDHNTIATYINDFKVVLSIVWSQDAKSAKINHDVILESKEHVFSIEKVVTENKFNINDDEVLKMDSELVTNYNHMIEVVKKDYKKYKKFLGLFEKSKKFIKINELYKEFYNEDNKCDNISVIKELLPL